MVPPAALSSWQKYLNSKAGRAAHGIHGAPVFWIDNKRGTGCRDVRKAVLSAGEYVNQRRARRDIRPRAIRAAVIGYPNVGKSALINQLVGRRRVSSRVFRQRFSCRMHSMHRMPGVPSSFLAPFFPNVFSCLLAHIYECVRRKSISRTLLAQAASADRPGVTRALQWIRLGSSASSGNLERGGGNGNGSGGCDIELL